VASTAARCSGFKLESCGGKMASRREESCV
jgi:hypothetical protein